MYFYFLTRLKLQQSVDPTLTVSTMPNVFKASVSVEMAFELIKQNVWMWTNVKQIHVDPTLFVQTQQEVSVVSVAQDSGVLHQRNFAKVKIIKQNNFNILIHFLGFNRKKFHSINPTI